jgi:hypothetical protein
MSIEFACASSINALFTSEVRAPHDRKSAFDFGSEAASSTMSTPEDEFAMDKDNCGEEDFAPAGKFVSRHVDCSLIRAPFAFHERSSAYCRDTDASASEVSGANNAGEDVDDADIEDSSATEEAASESVSCDASDCCFNRSSSCSSLRRFSHTLYPTTATGIRKRTIMLIFCC